MNAEFKYGRIYFNDNKSNERWSIVDFLGDELAEAQHKARYARSQLTDADYIRLASAVTEASFLISILCNDSSTRIGRAKIKAIVEATKKQYSNPHWNRNCK